MVIIERHINFFEGNLDFILFCSGMPTYGRSFTLANPNKFKVNSAASSGGKAGEYTKEGGFLAYYEVSTEHHGLNPFRACTMRSWHKLELNCVGFCLVFFSS